MTYRPHWTRELDAMRHRVEPETTGPRRFHGWTLPTPYWDRGLTSHYTFRLDGTVWDNINDRPADHDLGVKLALPADLIGHTADGTPMYGKAW